MTDRASSPLLALSPPALNRLRLLAALLVGAAVFLFVPHDLGTTVRAFVGWDAGALLYLMLILVLMGSSTPASMRRRAAIQDPGRSVILGLMTAGASFSLLALGFIQKHGKSGTDEHAALYLGLTAATIIISWSVLHTVFALHYAHAYYGPAADEDDADGLVGGLEFPSEKEPDYWDFLYFAMVIGMTCQVSDVQVSERGMRRLALVHGVVSFVFNTVILALTVNIVAGLF